MTTNLQTVLNEAVKEFEKLFPVQSSPTGYGLRYYFNTKTNPSLWAEEMAKKMEVMVKTFITSQITQAVITAVEECLALKPKGFEPFTDRKREGKSDDYVTGFHNSFEEWEDSIRKKFDMNEPEMSMTKSN